MLRTLAESLAANWSSINSRRLASDFSIAARSSSGAMSASPLCRRSRRREPRVELLSSWGIWVERVLNLRALRIVALHFARHSLDTLGRKEVAAHGIQDRSFERV
jgi:hypothetical protein